MNEHDGYPSEHDETTEHGDAWVAGSGSVTAPEDESIDSGSSESGSSWGHQTEPAGETGDTTEGRAWNAEPETTEHDTTEVGTTDLDADDDHDLTDHDTADHDTADHDTAVEADPVAEHDTTNDVATGDLATGADTTGAAAAAEQPSAATTDNGTPPADTSGEQIEHLIDPAESDRFHETWRDIQSGFVDDPRDAVHQASTLAEEVLNALSTALKARVEAVEEGWQGGDEAADTERLRIALRGYRALLDQVLAG